MSQGQGQGQSLVGLTVARDMCLSRPVVTQPDAQAVVAVSLDLSRAG